MANADGKVPEPEPGSSGSEMQFPKGYIAEKLGLAYEFVRMTLAKVIRGSTDVRKRGRIAVAPGPTFTEEPASSSTPHGSDALPGGTMDQAAGHQSPVFRLADGVDRVLHEAAESAEQAKYIHTIQEELHADRYRRQITG